MLAQGDLRLKRRGTVRVLLALPVRLLRAVRVTRHFRDTLAAMGKVVLPILRFAGAAPPPRAPRPPRT